MNGTMSIVRPPGNCNPSVPVIAMSGCEWVNSVDDPAFRLRGRPNNSRCSVGQGDMQVEPHRGCLIRLGEVERQHKDEQGSSDGPDKHSHRAYAGKIPG